MTKEEFLNLAKDNNWDEEKDKEVLDILFKLHDASEQGEKITNHREKHGINGLDIVVLSKDLRQGRVLCRRSFLRC
ncbi:MAG: hypothetical protein IKO61_10470 [Lachnospiraceae bacterium]|nr:hypothetical protein [Lachnospiraceae bacterium]